MTDWITRINQLLDEDLSSRNWPSQRLGQAMHYAVCSGGKRSRATLAYLVGTGLGLAPEAIDSIAMAIECLHAYTLVHDDLPAMDNDDWRRHQPSCHKAFDEATAILAGDALQTHAFTLLCEGRSDHKLEQIKYFTQAVGAAGLCSGQSLDMIHTADDCNLTTLYQIHRLKTGVLIAAACCLPGIAADCSETERAQLQVFGEALGLLLQINDDLIDDQKDTGKSRGKDQAQKKASMGTQLNQTEAQTKLQEAVHDCKEKLSQLKHLLRNTSDIHKRFLSKSSTFTSAKQKVNPN